MRSLTLISLASALIISPLFSEETAPEPKPKSKAPAIKKINENEYQIGKVHLNKTTQEISFGAGVNLDKGLLEYILVNPKGKVHESLFISDISPLHLNIAIKLLGIGESPELFALVDENHRPTKNFPKVDAKTKNAARIDILVEFTEGKISKRVPLNDLILHVVTGKSMDPGPWLNSGSYMHDGKYKAEVSGDLIAILTSQPAMINYPGKDRENDDVWVPHTKRVPEEGTVVKIILKPHQP